MIAFTLVNRDQRHEPRTRAALSRWPCPEPGAALAKLFLTNAENGRNTDNDSLVIELLKRRRAIQELANRSGPGGTTTVG
ncbi:MAG: hypothetical protein ACRDS0_28680 [Pseudonocardiaceae bacterium]